MTCNGTGANAVYVAGFGSLTNGVKRPVLWVNGGTPIDLAANLGTTRAGTNYAVNSSGVSVGQVQYTVGGSTVWRGFRTTGGTNALATTGDDLPPPSEKRTQYDDPPPSDAPTKATAENSFGDAVGSYRDEFNNREYAAYSARRGTNSANPSAIHLSVWSAPILQGAIDIQSLALGLNDSGAIVGWSRNTNTVRAVYRLGAGSGWRDLNDKHFVHGLTGWSLNQATAINGTGVVVGNGLLNGQARGYILVPRTVGN